MIEEDLRALFARADGQPVATEGLRSRIDRAATRRRVRQVTTQLSAVAVLVVAAVLSLPMLTRVAVPVADVVAGDPWPSGPINALMIGIDEDKRSDNVTILHIPADRSKIYLVSFERDVLVDFPGGGQGKLADTFAAGTTEQVISTMTGVQFDARVVITGPALGRITDALGGIEVCLPGAVQSWHDRTLVHPAGCSRYNGVQVADLVRQRAHLEWGAYDRDRNTHRVFAGLAAAKPDIKALIQLLGTDGITVDARGKSLLDFAELVRHVGPGQVTGIGQPGFRPIERREGKEAVAYEELDPVVAAQLFARLRAGQLDQFVAAYPGWVTPLQR